MSNTIDNTQVIIDSRDVIERLEELQEERQDLVDAVEDAEGKEAKRVASEALEEWDNDNGNDLRAIKALAEEGENCAADWLYGEALIRESYFVEYCQDLCEDIGDLPKEMPSYLVIDWEATAKNLQQDYTSIDFDGVTYLVR
jgi:hypothetical protein